MAFLHDTGLEMNRPSEQGLQSSRHCRQRAATPVLDLNLGSEACSVRAWRSRRATPMLPLQLGLRTIPELRAPGLGVHSDAVEPRTKEPAVSLDRHRNVTIAGRGVIDKGSIKK